MNSTQEPRSAEILRSRDFRLYIVGRFLWTLAVQIQSVAVGWQVYDRTEDPLALGLVGLALFLPVAILTLPAGDVADRFDRRRILWIASCAQAVSAAALLGFALAGDGGTAGIYAAVALFGAARAFLGPAQQSVLPLLVPQPLFAAAVAWGQSAFKIATIAGPAVGGLLYVFGPEAAYGACIALQLAVAASVLMIATPGRRGTDLAAGVGAISRLVAGIDYVRNSPIILGAISLDLFAVLLGGAVALLPIYARDLLMVGPEGLGVLRAAPSIGGIAAALLLARRPLGRHAGAWMFAAVAVFGAGTIVFGLSRDFYLSLAALAVVGAADMISVFVRSTAIQLATPDAMRGRVSAVNLLFIGASNELGEFRAGAMAAWIGVVPAVVFGGIGTLAAVALWMRLFPALREMDRLEDLAPSKGAAA